MHFIKYLEAKSKKVEKALFRKCHYPENDIFKMIINES